MTQNKLSTGFFSFTAGIPKIIKRLFGLIPAPEQAQISHDSPLSFIMSLPAWDGTHRASHWLSNYLGADNTEYSRLVSLFFLRAMVMRALHPGCKFDYCLVLEGGQGSGKSSAIQILSAGFSSDFDFESGRDGIASLGDKWLCEISEMGSLIRAEAGKQKSFLSRQKDQHRPAYSKTTVIVPRQALFIGTTNEDAYLSDTYSGRRFWPVQCHGDANLDSLRANLNQLFAEALHDIQRGERYWPSLDEQREHSYPEQYQRSTPLQPKPIDDLLQEWVAAQNSPFTLTQACTEGLGLSAEKLTPSIMTRIGITLRFFGCQRIEQRQPSVSERRRLFAPPGWVETQAPAAD